MKTYDRTEISLFRFRCLYPTFKEWKPMDTLNLNSWYFVYILPLRNENRNNECAGFKIGLVYILPLRNENQQGLLSIQ